jgi:hypothetical protein
MKPDEPKKRYAPAKSEGAVSLKEPDKEITQRCTVNYVDVSAAPEALNQTLTQNSD